MESTDFSAETTSLIINGVIIVILLALSCLFSFTETAFTAASRGRLHQLAKDGSARAKMINRLREQPERVIITILISNNLVNILSSALATGVLISVFGQDGVLIATGVMTILVLIFGEIIPKTFALQQADRFVIILAPFIKFFVWLMYPFTMAFRRVCQVILKPFGASKKSVYGASLSDEELLGTIELHGEDTNDILYEKAMLKSIIDLDERTISEVMTHRKNVLMIAIDQPIKEVVHQVIVSGYSRFPVYEGKMDNIVGILHTKNLLRLWQQQSTDTTLPPLTLKQVMTDAWFVPDSTDLMTQLLAFQKRQEHMAIIVDEYGVFEGIVTLEDILEQIVGQIDDEHDRGTHRYQRLNDGSVVVNGDVAVHDLNRELGWNLPSNDASTLAGYLMFAAEKIPHTNQVFRFHDYRFQVLKKKRNQLLSIRVTPPQTTEK